MTDHLDLKTSKRLIFLLKKRGAMSTKNLAEALGLSVPGVRRHLDALGDQVVSETLRQGVGRPAAVWRLTDKAAHHFPDTHAEMTVRLIDSVTEVLGESALEQVLADRYVKNLETYREKIGTGTVDERLERLAVLRDAEGYMPSVERVAEGQWRFSEQHCPICIAAERCRGFCKNELQLFREVLGEDVAVERTEYLLDGDSRCAYRVSSN